METGANGVNGTYVAKHVNKENSPGAVNVTHPLLNMAERIAMENPMKYDLAMKMFHAQASKIFTRSILASNKYVFNFK